MPDLAAAVRRKVDRRLMPFLFVLFVIAYMDRVNVGFAGLRMTHELGFSDAVFGFGGGVFFLGYFLLEIPGTVLVEVWSARKWISRIMISWGFLAAATGLIHTAGQFYWIRFLLGLAEAGFFPGILVYISHWYRAEDRGRAVAMFMAAIPTAQVIGAPVAGVILRVHWLGYDGWRWLLVIEGLPALLFGVITFFYLTDHPHEAHWLKPREREWLAGQLEAERARRTAHPSAWRALGNPQVLLLAAISLLGLTPNYGLSLWLPKMVQRLSAFSVTQVSLVAAIPYLCSVPAMTAGAGIPTEPGSGSGTPPSRDWHREPP